MSVPNIWYNQTFELRVSAVRWDAKLAEEQAAKYKKNPPFGVSEEIAADIARRYRERAGMIHAEADRMQAAGDAVGPVAAARLQLNYGPSVF